MATMERSQKPEINAVNTLVQWATSGLPSLLASSVESALRAIATTGECRGCNEAWVLFGEVVEAHEGPPFSAKVHRTSMLMQADETLGGSWTDFDLVCPVAHQRVDFAPGMWLGVLISGLVFNTSFRWSL